MAALPTSIGRFGGKSFGFCTGFIEWLPIGSAAKRCLRLGVLLACALALPGLLYLWSPLCSSWLCGLRYDAMQAACYKGDGVGVALLLLLGADPTGDRDYSPDAVGVEFSSHVMMAVAGSHPIILRMLLLRGATPDLQEGEGITPLNVAYVENPACVPLLLAAGAKRDAGDSRASGQANSRPGDLR